MITRIGWGDAAGAAGREGPAAGRLAEAAGRDVELVATEVALDSPAVDVATEVIVIAFSCMWCTPLESYALYNMGAPLRRLISRVVQ